MRLIQWCRTPSIALAIAASAISTHSAVAESPISGRLENIDVSYLDVLNLGSFSQVQQVSDEEPVAEEAAEAAQEPAPLTDGEGVESAAPMPAYAQSRLLHQGKEGSGDGRDEGRVQRPLLRQRLQLPE